MHSYMCDRGTGLHVHTNPFIHLRAMIEYRGTTVRSALSFIGGVHIGARALLDINLISFGNIAFLSQFLGGGYFTRSNYFYLPSVRLGGGGGSAPCGIH